MPSSTRSKSTATRSDFPDLESLTGDSRAIVEILVGRFDALSAEFQAKLKSQDDRIEKLEQQVTNLKTDMSRLEVKVDDSEAYERRDTVILSGESVPTVPSTGEITSNVACDLIQSKLRILVAPSDISVAHRIGRRSITQAADRRSIIVKLCRRDLKRDLLQASRSLKPENFYVNESLTPKRNAFLQTLRIAKRRFPEKISGCSSQDGKVCVWVRAPDRTSRDSRVFINSFVQLEDFCTKTLKSPVTSLGIASHISNQFT